MIFPPVPSFNDAVFCAMIPGSALLIDALDGVMGSPVGQTVRNDFVVASSSIVMFTATEVAPAGTLPTPAMATSSVPFALMRRRRGDADGTAVGAAGVEHPLGCDADEERGGRRGRRLAGDEVLALAAACADGERTDRHCSAEQRARHSTSGGRSTRSRRGRVLSTDKGRSLVVVWDGPAFAPYPARARTPKDEPVGAACLPGSAVGRTPPLAARAHGRAPPQRHRRPR